jgi:hypothetical protein
VTALGEVATFEVSIVTGANDFFTVTEESLARWELHEWAEPLLARIRHANGIVFDSEDHEAVRRKGAASWILRFDADRADPLRKEPPAAYLSLGEDRELDRRFKCRIREPWYRVPNFQKGELLLSKRSHLYPRVVLNRAGVFTTDTIYRGRLLHPSRWNAHDFVASFHNSLTLLTAEMEGRSFGGGVLEMVPSEVGRLLVPIAQRPGGWLADLDRVARAGDPEALVAATDKALVRAGVFERDVLAALASARNTLLSRRMDRNRTPRGAASSEELALAA